MIDLLCTCTNTYKKYSNLIKPYPENPSSIDALFKLNCEILTPVINCFGYENFQLIYGFCSKDLKKFIAKEKSRVCTTVDQHMAHEVNSRGNYYCKHLGAACDFAIAGINSKKIIVFLRRLNFDSIYYYGENQPIHVSWSESPRRKIWEFTQQNTPIPYRNYYCV